MPPLVDAALKHLRETVAKRLEGDADAESRLAEILARTADERLLATRLTARNVKSATQFCGSAIVSVPTGGRKKKLKAIIAATEVVTATQSAEVAAATSTMSRNVSATMLAFETWMTWA